MKAFFGGDMEQKMDRISQEEVLRELGSIAFGEASDASGAAVKVASKLKALELLGKHFGIFEGRPRQESRVVIVEDL